MADDEQKPPPPPRAGEKSPHRQVQVERWRPFPKDEAEKIQMAIANAETAEGLGWLLQETCDKLTELARSQGFLCSFKTVTVYGQGYLRAQVHQVSDMNHSAIVVAEGYGPSRHSAMVLKLCGLDLAADLVKHAQGGGEADDPTPPEGVTYQ